MSTRPQPELTPERILQVGMGFWASKAMLSAVELGVFAELAQSGPLDADALARQIGIQRRGARDLFDALVSLHFLERQDGLYLNTPETNAFLDRSKPSYIGGMLEMAGVRLYHSWGSLTEALRSGRPQSEAPEEGTIFDALVKDPPRLKQFMTAMTGICMGTSKAIAAKFPWADYRTFADIGTAQGGLPVQLARAHEHLTGIGFDLPAVQPIFDEYVAGFGLGKRLRFQPGDFFADPLPAADVLIMGHILHGLGLEQKRELVGKAHAALRPGGALIVFEALIDDERRENTFGLLMSLNMLIETREGFDYTGAECSAWLCDAGFRETRVERLAGPDAMVVGVK